MNTLLVEHKGRSLDVATAYFTIGGFGLLQEGLCSLGNFVNLQEKVIDDILRPVQEQRAIEAAPRSVDPIQQTVATVLQGYLNHPDVDRR